MDATGRMLIACSSCAKAKVKCNKQLPCSRCASRQTVCQVRSAHTSSNTSIRKAHRPLSPSSKVPGPFHRNDIFKTAEAVDRQAKSTDHQLQWTTYPHKSVNYSRNHPGPIDPLEYDNSMQTTAQRDHIKSEAYLLDGLQESSPELSFPPTPSMQDARIEDLVQMNGAGWDQDDEYHFAMISSSQSPLNFEVPNSAGFMPPALSGTHNIDMAPGMSQNLSAAWNTSPRSLAHSPHKQSPSVISSPDSRWISYHPPSTSSQYGLQEHQSVIATQAQWRSFRCNPVMDPSACPQTAKVHLVGLEQTLKNQEAWDSWDTQPYDVELSVDQKILIEPLLESTRDKLLATIKESLYKSIRTYSIIVDSSTAHHSPISNSAAFITLPPSRVLEYFFRSHFCCCEPYYSSIPAGRLKTNELSNGIIPSHLLLLMIAQGAMATPTIEARYLTSGLTEACRISLLEDIEKNPLLVSHPIVLQCALLLTNLVAWSGDKWHMDIAMGQRGMYLAMLSNAGMLEYREIRLSLRESQANLWQAWKAWKEQESRSRLVYSWVTVDQELSLFHDTAPTLSVADLHTTMPDADALWQAKSESEWFKSLQEVSGAPHKRPPSLRDFFRRFLEAEGNFAENWNDTSAIQLRSVLHPLQSMVCHIRQLLSCLSSSGVSHRKTPQAITRSATSARLNEVQSLLQQWYALSIQCVQSSTGFCPVSCVSLIMYHLISLNTIICFVEIEQLARCERIQDVFRQFYSLQMCCIERAQEIFFHCGQILRLACSMPQAVRPPWWPAAVYRVALISWVNSMAGVDARFQLNQSAPKESGNRFTIDTLEPENPSIYRYLKFREGIPIFSKRDGSAVSLSAAPGEILTHCVELLNEESTTRFASGIKTRLEKLAERWKR